MGQVIPLGGSEAEECAWQQLQDMVAELQVRPELLRDRAFYARYVAAHERYRRAFVANGLPGAQIIPFSPEAAR